MTKRLMSLLAAPALVVAAALTIAACGGGGPTNPSGTGGGPPPPTGNVTTFKVSDGNSKPVSGAMVVPDGVSPQPTDANGNATFAQNIFGKNISVDALSFGFVLRQTTVTADGSATLWKEDLDYLSQMVYHQWAPGRRLTRPNPGSFTVSVSNDIAADARAMASVNVSIAEISAKTGVKLSLVASGGQFTIVVNPNDQTFVDNPTYGAFNRLKLQGNHILGGDIVFREIQHLHTDIVLHELGHGLGWGHSPDGDVMCTPCSGHNFTSFTISPRLQALWAMMAGRKVGQASPDNDQGVSGLARGPVQTIVIICER